ncbi:MAG: hypothetical protein WC882_05830 [Candidatus Gracilibacteria bacterium]
MLSHAPLALALAFNSPAEAKDLPTTPMSVAVEAPHLLTIAECEAQRFKDAIRFNEFDFDEQYYLEDHAPFLYREGTPVGCIEDVSAFIRQHDGLEAIIFNTLGDREMQRSFSKDSADKDGKIHVLGEWVEPVVSLGVSRWRGLDNVDLKAGLKYLADQSEKTSQCKTAEGRHTDPVTQDPLALLAQDEKKNTFLLVNQLFTRTYDRFQGKYGVFDMNKDCFVDSKDDVAGPNGSKKPDGMITLEDWQVWQERTREGALHAVEPK